MNEDFLRCSLMFKPDKEDNSSSKKEHKYDKSQSLFCRIIFGLCLFFPMRNIPHELASIKRVDESLYLNM